MRAYTVKGAFLSLLIVVAPAWANAKTCICPPKQHKQTICVFTLSHLPSWYIDVGAGWVFNQKLGTTYLANPFPEITAADKYNSPKIKQVPMGLLSAGYVWSRLTKWLPFTSLGVEYSYDMPAKIKGGIEELSDPKQANVNYKFKVGHHNLHLMGKADLIRWRNWMPYLSAGIGASWNRFSNYNEEQIVANPRPNPEFPNKTKLNFSYSLGTGVDYIFTKRLWGSLGYRFDNFGWEKSGDTTKFLDKNLKDMVRAHTLIFSLRYLFG